MFVVFLMIAFSSSPNNNNFHRPSEVGISICVFFSICGSLNDMFLFESFLSLPRLATISLENVDELSRNIMCKRTLPSFLVVQIDN